MIIKAAAANTFKVTAGGAGVGGASYVATEKVLQASDNATLAAQSGEWAVVAASVCTAIYFFVMACRTGWQWKQDIKAAKEMLHKKAGKNGRKSRCR